MKYLGIDPGKSNGGICLLSEDGKTIYTTKMPPSPEEFYDYLKRLEKDHGRFICGIERVSHWNSDIENMGKQHRIAKMVANFDSMCSILRIARVPTVLISPVTWQNHIKEFGYDKTEFKNPKHCWQKFGQERWPWHKISLRVADAVCIAWAIRIKAKLEPKWIMDNLVNDDQKNLFKQ